MTSLFYGGTEIPGWRKLLAEAGAKHVALSYMGLRRRTKFVRPWVIAERYPEDQVILLDSGCHTLNKTPGKLSDIELLDLAAHYYEWALANFDRLEAVVEFDARQLGRETLNRLRAVHAPAFGQKFMPVWHSEDGLSEATALAASYTRLGILQANLGDQDLTAWLNNLVRGNGTLLHGMAMTKPDLIRTVAFDSVASTSWLSPAQFGDTQIFSGGQLHRYPKAYKTKARTRHFREIQDAGFNAQAIADDTDSIEVLRLAVWSWERTMESINHRNAVTASPDTPLAANTETGTELVAEPAPKTRNPIARRQERKTLPFLARRTETETFVDDNGVRREREVSVLRTSGRNLINCNSCYINSVCDAYRPDTECVYDITVDLRSKLEREAAYDTVEEILLERFLRGYAVEQANGGYLDANVSAEADRIGRFRKMRAEASADRFKVTVEAASQSGNMGMISRIFGQDEGEKARALEAPQPVTSAFAEMGVVDAEVVGEDFAT